MKFHKMFTYYRDDYVVCVKLLYTFLVQHNMIMVESSDIVLMCACTCMQLLVGSVCVCVCVRASEQNVIHAINISFAKLIIVK